MGTRGICGFVVDNDVKAAYNHFDSYPGELGVDVIEYIRPRLDSLDGWTKRVREIKIVESDSESPAPPELLRIARELGTIDTNVGGLGVEHITIYQCFRGAQGRLDLYEDLGHIPDGSDFVNDSLFCEWGYLVNLDEQVLEVYRGFQTQSHDLGRFAGSSRKVNEHDSSEYAPIALLRAIPFSEIAARPTDRLAEELEFLAYGDEEED